MNGQMRRLPTPDGRIVVGIKNKNLSSVKVWMLPDAGELYIHCGFLNDFLPQDRSAEDKCH